MALRKTEISVVISTVEYDQNDVADPATRTVVVDYQRVLSAGTGGNQADRAYVDRSRTYTASTAVDHDLNTYTDSFGNASQAIAKARVVCFRSETTTSGQSFQVGGDSASGPVFGAAADYAIVGPDGLFLLVNPIDGYTVTATTGDIVQITPPAAAVAGTLIIAGSS
jgi:hypothetical protein